MRHHNRNIDKLDPDVSWALNHAPELATDAWLRSAGHAPRATLTPLQFARSAARRDGRIGGSRGPEFATRINDEVSESFYLRDHADPLSILIATENTIEDSYDASPSLQLAIAARAFRAHRTRRRGQQLEASRLRAREAGQLGFGGLGWAIAQ